MYAWHLLDLNLELPDDIMEFLQKQTRVRVNNMDGQRQKNTAKTTLLPIGNTVTSIQQILVQILRKSWWEYQGRCMLRISPTHLDIPALKRVILTVMFYSVKWLP